MHGASLGEWKDCSQCLWITGNREGSLHFWLHTWASLTLGGKKKKTNKNHCSILYSLLAFWNTSFFLSKAVDLENYLLGLEKSFLIQSAVFFFFCALIRQWQVTCRQVRTLGDWVPGFPGRLTVSIGGNRWVSLELPCTILSMLYHLL